MSDAAELAAFADGSFDDPAFDARDFEESDEDTTEVVCEIHFFRLVFVETLKYVETETPLKLRFFSFLGFQRPFKVAPIFLILSDIEIIICFYRLRIRKRATILSALAVSWFKVQSALQEKVPLQFFG